jgi:hypothetical protein
MRPRGLVLVAGPTDSGKSTTLAAMVDESVMQTSTQRGMQTMEHGLAELIRKRLVAVEAALAVSSRKEQLVGMLEPSSRRSRSRARRRGTGRRVRARRREGEGAPGNPDRATANRIRIGEETGEPEKMLDKIADFYEDEVDASIRALTSIVEPLMMIGVDVGIIIISMYMPMFKLRELVQ